MKKIASKTFSLQWAFEAFEDHPSFFKRRMFGGLSAYVHGRLVMVLAESPGDRGWKGKFYPFDIWNGIMFPTEKELHKSVQREFESLHPHPILSKWLYLPMSNKNFEQIAEKISFLIAKDDSRFGVYPKEKMKQKKSAVKKT